MALDSYALIPNALVVEGGQGSCVFMLQEDSFAPPGLPARSWKLIADGWPVDGVEGVAPPPTPSGSVASGGVGSVNSVSL